MKVLEITFYGPQEPNGRGGLERKVVMYQSFPLEPIEKHGMMFSPGTPMGFSQAQMFEVRIVDAPDPEIVVPQQVSDVNHPKG